MSLLRGNPAGLSKTGLTTVILAGDDGTRQEGVLGFDRLVDNGDGTIYDPLTGLMWVKDHAAVGSPFDAIMTWANAITNCEALTYAGHTDWYLPNIAQLISIRDWEEVLGDAFPAPFANGEADYYWVSTPHTNSPTNAMRIRFWSNSGTVVIGAAMTELYFVRPVRNGATA